jgi:hypothetical protein
MTTLFRPRVKRQDRALVHDDSSATIQARRFPEYHSIRILWGTSRERTKEGMGNS